MPIGILICGWCLVTLKCSHPTLYASIHVFNEIVIYLANFWYLFLRFWLFDKLWLVYKYNSFFPWYYVSLHNCALANKDAKLMTLIWNHNREYKDFLFRKDVSFLRLLFTEVHAMSKVIFIVENWDQSSFFCLPFLFNCQNKLRRFFKLKF